MFLKVLIPVVSAALIAWGAWATIGVTSALPEEKFETHEAEFSEHKEKDNDKFTEVLKEIQRQRENIEEKLDEIQKSL
jgi:tryptophanyl-tRNA synthetase